MFWVICTQQWCFLCLAHTSDVSVADRSGSLQPPNTFCCTRHLAGRPHSLRTYPLLSTSEWCSAFVSESVPYCYCQQVSDPVFLSVSQYPIVIVNKWVMQCFCQWVSTLLLLSTSEWCSVFVNKSVPYCYCQQVSDAVFLSTSQDWGIIINKSVAQFFWLKSVTQCFCLPVSTLMLWSTSKWQRFCQIQYPDVVVNK